MIIVYEVYNLFWFQHICINVCINKVAFVNFQLDYKVKRLCTINITILTIMFFWIYFSFLLIAYFWLTISYLPLRHFLENLYSHWREPEKNSCKYTIMSLSKLFILRRIWRGLLFKQWRIERRRKNHRAIRRKKNFRLRLLFLWTREIIRDWN